MAKWQERDRNVQRRRRRSQRRAEWFDQLWIDLCYCGVCEAHVWHVEVANEAVRNGYLPPCGDCGGRLVVVDRDGRGQSR